MTKTGYRLCLIALLATTSGCTTWKVAEEGAREALAEGPRRARITLAGGRRVELHRPGIRNDSLLGFRGDERIAIPLEKVSRIELRRVSAVRTGLLAAGVGITVLLIANRGGDQTTSTPADSLVFSCPLVYSWDGAGWRLDSGTFGGAITEGLARTDVDNLDHAVATDGVVRLKVANELAETDHLDALRLVAVDHAPGTRVAPAPDGTIVGFGPPRPPDRARDFRGRDALARVASKDDWSWESSLADDVPARDGLELEFRRPAGATEARLVIDAHNTPWSAHLLTEYLRAHGDGLEAWYADLDSDPEDARRFFGRIARDAFLDVAVQTRTGWRGQGLVWEAGPELVKRQVVSLDLEEVEGDVVRVRLTAPASFWLVDHVAIDYGPEPAVTVHEIDVATARTRDGRDVRGEIGAPDGRAWTIETGDWAEVTFDVPPVSPGRARTYLLASTGWYRVHAGREGPPDRALLTAFEHESGAIARLSLERRRDALTALRPGR